MERSPKSRQECQVAKVSESRSHAEPSDAKGSRLERKGNGESHTSSSHSGLGFVPLLEKHGHTITAPISWSRPVAGTAASQNSTPLGVYLWQILIVTLIAV